MNEKIAIPSKQTLPAYLLFTMLITPISIQRHAKTTHTHHVNLLCIQTYKLIINNNI